MEESVFTKIIKGEIPSFKVYEDDDYYAFLDIMPINTGHTLVVPKKQVDYIFDLDEEIYHGLFDVVKKLSGPIQRATECKRVGLVVEGFAVPHVHVHVIPLFTLHEIKPENQHEVPKEEQQAMQEKILNELKTN